MTNPLALLAKNGVSIWLDDLSRTRIQTGALKELITSRSVSGVTTNPTIFAGALAKGEGYSAQVAELAAAGVSASEAVFEITTRDVADAALRRRGGGGGCGRGRGRGHRRRQHSGTYRGSARYSVYLLC